MENNTIAILLAGGKSGRMGLSKGLLKYDNTFWILEQIRRISKTSVSHIYIGLGYHYQHYFDAIDWFESAKKEPYLYLGVNVKVVINGTPELGSFSTLQKVLNEIPTGKDILLNPIDVPLISKEPLQKIIDGTNLITLPNFAGKNGHPIKLKYDFWKELIALNPSNKDARLDFQIKKTPRILIAQILVSDKVVLQNINTPSAWKSYLKSNQ